LTNENQAQPNSKPVESVRAVNPFLLIGLTLLTGAIFAVLIFPIAQDWAWMEGWIFIILFLVVYLANMLSINQKNPEVIRNRMTAKRQSMVAPTTSDKIFFLILGPTMIMAFVLPSLNHRYHWSTVPLGVEIGGFVLVVVGFILIYRTMFENAYASKVLDIRPGQRVIDTGIYSYIRHPMYSGYTLMTIGVTLGLGDWWSMIPGILTGVILYVRSILEEKMLIAGLPGYAEYMKKVKKRLIPFLI
jgi:protein-S-isoprenylcysteine O-methyltransferase Ste14